MSQINNAVADAIKKMALMENHEDRRALKADAAKHSIGDWKMAMIAKTSGVGFLSGLPGGPVGLALEAGDIAYLLAMAGRACYGVGHIHGCEINYEDDIPMILAIWAGVGEASAIIPAGKVGVKIAPKLGVKQAAILSPIAAKMAGKILAKTSLKGGGKIAPKIFAAASAKIVSKIVAKSSTKWIPIIGGIVGAGINGWVMDSIIDAATKYYTHEYLVFSGDILDA